MEREKGRGMMYNEQAPEVIDETARQQATQATCLAVCALFAVAGVALMVCIDMWFLR